MPLLDHFHPPLNTQRHWDSFQTTWATAIADSLNQDWLPEGYFAEEQLYPAARFESAAARIDSGAATGCHAGEAATGTLISSPAAPKWKVRSAMIEGTEVLIFNGEGGPALVAAVELVSPANKESSETRRAFATKCASYLHQGIGLAIVDVVTSCSANLHNELISLLDQNPLYRMRSTDAPYAAAYRPLRHGDHIQIEVWPHELATGKALPDFVPLWLGQHLLVPLDLESTYMNACHRRRVTC